MSEPVLIKTWRIFNWAPDDVAWLEEQGYVHRVATTNVPFAQGNKIVYMRGDVGVSVETRTEQEEMLLRLKFDPGMVLMLEEVVMPGTLTECVLSDLGKTEWGFDRVVTGP